MDQLLEEGRISFDAMMPTLETSHRHLVQVMYLLVTKTKIIQTQFQEPQYFYRAKEYIFRLNHCNPIKGRSLIYSLLVSNSGLALFTDEKQLVKNIN